MESEERSKGYGMRGKIEGEGPVAENIAAHVGMRKPAEDIYRYCIVRLHEFVKTKGYGDGVKPEDIVFLDDIGTNLRTAKKLGMRTIKVTLGSVNQAVKELEQVTGLDLSDKAKL